MRKNFSSRAVATLLWVSFPVALASFVHQITAGPSTLSIASLRLFDVDLSLALRLDPLSTVVFLMVSLLAAVVGQYALRYLDGDARQWPFFRALLPTVAAVFLLVLSSNLVMFVAAWLAMSAGLHRLLVLHPDRPAAVYAARKKFLVSRLGDAALLVAVALIYRLFGTFDFGEIFARLDAAAMTFGADERWQLSLAAALLAAGAMTKSVQVPFHFWLPETMETPTPVSALMHAGIINAGGFLVLRLSPLISHAEIASAMLATAGALTAVYGALVMATQNNIKSKLAYSTISQMGMMMFACGIQAYAFALFHIVAHSFYKAHAFLSTGTLVDERRRLNLPPTASGTTTCLVVVVAGYALIGFGVYWQNAAHLAGLTYVSVLLIGLSQNVGIALRKSAWTSVAVLGALVAASAAYILMEAALGQFVPIEAANPVGPIVNLIAFSVFAAGLFLNRMLVVQRSELSRRIYMALWNGGYLGNLSTRALSRVWPA
jgi:NAD(P)H-quinone oxidoreductase subunit 5